MAVPLIWVAVMGARIAAPTIIRFVASKGAKQAAKKYGSSVVRQVTKMAKTYKGRDKSMINAAKLLTKGTGKTLAKTVTKGGKRFKFVAKSAKQKAIQAKIKAKGKPKPKPRVKTKAKPAVKPRVKTKAKPTKAKPTKVKRITKAKVKVKTKAKPVVKPAVKPKPKPFFTPPKVLGGAAVIGGTALLLKKKRPKKDIKIVIRPKPDAPRKKPGPQSGPDVKTKLKDIPGSSQYGVIRTGPQVKKKFTEEREKSFESRVRALVAQKDRLKNIPAGDGVRSEYQVRMNKLKKENKKAFKKMFKLGGFGNLKD